MQVGECYRGGREPNTDVCIKHVHNKNFGTIFSGAFALETLRLFVFEPISFQWSCNFDPS